MVRGMASGRGIESGTKIAILKLFIERQSSLTSNSIFSEISPNPDWRSRRCFLKQLSPLKENGILTYDAKTQEYSLPSALIAETIIWLSDDYFDIVYALILKKKKDKIVTLMVDVPESIGQTTNVDRITFEKFANIRQWNNHLEQFCSVKSIEEYRAQTTHKKKQVKTEMIAFKLLNQVFVFKDVLRAGGILGVERKKEITEIMNISYKFLKSKGLSQKQRGVIEHLLRVMDTLISEGTINTLDMQYDFHTQRNLP